MIIALALRICAKFALSGATIADDRVDDSSISALADLAKDTPKPFVVISTDDQSFDVTNLDVTGGTRGIDLVIDIAVGSATTLPGGDMAVVIPHTDAGTELSVNILTRQVMRTLFEPNSGGEWGRLFRAIASKVNRVMIRRGAGAEKGTRFSAAQIIMQLQTMYEPAFGAAPEGLWIEFLTAVRNEPKIAPLADGIEAAIIGAPVPDWLQMASVLGLSNEEAFGLGILPLGGEGSVPANEATILPAGFVINDSVGLDQLPADWPDDRDDLTDQGGDVLADETGNSLVDED